MVSNDTFIAERLADHVLAVTAGDLPDDAIHWAKLGILDTLAVTLAGIPEPCVQSLLRVPGLVAPQGPCRILGTDRMTSVFDAGLVNGTASHALDFDDVNNNIGGHPSVMLVPALFALGEEMAAAGQDVLTAYIAGFEAETRLGRAVNFHHYEKGWHPTVTLGIFGTVAAAAHLLKLDRATTATALGLACSLASGLKANFGTMTKPLHVGHAVRNGLLAVRLAEQGYTANAGAFEHQQGFLDVFNGPGTYDMERLFANWGAPYDVMDDGPGLKQYPCCGSTHAAIDCALELRRAHSPDPGDVREITMRTNPRRLPHTDNPDPRSDLEAKFSVHYVLVRALLDGAVGLTHFENDAHLDPVVRELMAKVTAGVHPDMGPDSPHHFGAEVTIRLSDGRTLSHRIDNRVCRGPADAMTDEEVFAKFADCATRVLADDAVRPLYDSLMALDSAPDISGLAAAMTPGGAAFRAAE